MLPDAWPVVNAGIAGRCDVLFRAMPWRTRCLAAEAAQAAFVGGAGPLTALAGWCTKQYAARTCYNAKGTSMYKRRSALHSLSIEAGRYRVKMAGFLQIRATFPPLADAA
jgi:hypothetical protein